MTTLTNVDYIIVGQGLSGSALAYHLIKQGKKVVVMDEEQPNTSSKVAAGLYNPITGRKLVKTWLADKLFPYLTDYYREVEEVCSADFLNDNTIYRPFISLEEQNEWMGKSAAPEFNQFIKMVRRSPLSPYTKDGYGGVELACSGYLDVPVYLKAISNWLKNQSSYYKVKFDFEKLILKKDHVVYEDHSAKKLIFCDGLESMNNPFFSWLPFKPVKGEILKIEMEVDQKQILNRGVFVIPLGGNIFNVGANYDNNDATWGITQKARKEIEDRLKELISIDYTILDQKAGIRPATRDRRPFLGMHPENETIGVFNGLGAKGVSLSPYFAGHFTDFLVHGQELDKEVDVNRYFSLYYMALKNK